MANVQKVKNILISLIESIDTYNFLLRDHHRRTATIAYLLGNEFGLNAAELSNLVLTASIHDIGALHVTERDKLLYIDAVDTSPHEILGEKILLGFKPFSHISKVIRHHHIKYSEVKSGIVPENEVPIECYFIHLADRIDVIMATCKDSSNIKEYVVQEINARFGSVFMPELKEIFNILTATDEFWENINNSSYHDLLFMAVDSEECQVDDEDMDALAILFARIVDHKSHWTLNHSKSVGALASQIAELNGMSDEKCHELKIAGYLHDIGKIAIPSEILDKHGSLDDNEFRTMKSHATYTSLILSKIPALGDCARWASCHHERRNKSGYPLRINDIDFTSEIDIIAYADVFAALAEDRPYRTAMTIEDIINILKGISVNQLDSSVFNVINANAAELYSLIS
jgi:HD-GYP domain-containing protein (c-di-GMP phosphodiesterase class II)